MDAIELSFSDKGMSYTVDEYDDILFELSKMKAADGCKDNPILLNSDTDSDVLLNGSIAQPTMLSGSTTSSDVNSNNEKNTDSINFEEDCFSDDSSLNTEYSVYSRKIKELFYPGFYS